MSEVGHNSTDKKKLKEFVDRLMDREKEKQAIAQDIRDIKTEIKGADMDPAAVAAIVKEKLRDSERAAKAARLAETVEQYKVQLSLL